MPTIADQIERALDGLTTLETLGQDVEDEWTYVTDLGDAWRSRLEEVAARRATEPATAEQAAAVDRAVEEAQAVTDPHRAIDWLSTFPQVVLVALGERP